MKPAALKTMSTESLALIRREIDRILPDKICAERAELQARLRKLSSVRIGHRNPNKGKRLPVKYRGPNGETWTGRGLMPRWLRNADRDAEDYRVG